MGQKVVFFSQPECIVTNFYWNMCLKQSRLKDEKLTNYAEDSLTDKERTFEMEQRSIR